MSVSSWQCLNRVLRALAVCAVLILTGCTTEPDGVIRFGLSSAPINLDPRYATDATSARINRLIYRRLVDFDRRTQPVPSLADWVALTPRHYRFRLGPEGRRFHDGAMLTARDVQATYDFILDPANHSPHRTSLRLIDHIESIDADTVDFYLKWPDRLLPAYLVIGIQPASAIEAKHPFNERPLGSGPFRFVAWPEPGRLRLIRMADDQPFEFLRVADPTVRVLKLLRGEIDLLQNDLPAELVAYLTKQANVRVTRRPGSNYSYLGFNLQDSLTGKHSVRKAVAHAIDRDAIIRHVLAGHARWAAAVFAPDHWVGDPSLKPVRHDPVLARKLLSKLGYNAQQPLPLTYKTSSDPLRIRLATVIQDQLARVGFKVKIQSYDWGTFYGDIKAGRFQMYSLAWVGIHTPDIFRYIFHSGSVPPEGANRGRFNDPQTDALIERAEAAGDIETQSRLFRALQRRLAELMPYVSLWYEDHIVAARRELTGYELAPDGNYDGLIQVQRSLLAEVGD